MGEVGRVGVDLRSLGLLSDLVQQRRQVVDLLKHRRLVLFLGRPQLFLEATNLRDDVELGGLTRSEWILEEASPNVGQQGLFFGDNWGRLD